MIKLTIRLSYLEANSGLKVPIAKNFDYPCAKSLIKKYFQNAVFKFEFTFLIYCTKCIIISNFINIKNNFVCHLMA